MTPRSILLELLGLAGQWRAAAFKATSGAEDYSVIRADYGERLFDAFISFVSQTKGAGPFKRQAGGAVVEDVPAAFERGIEDGGGDRTDLDPEDQDFANAAQGAQIGYLDGVFEWLKQRRAADDFTEADIQGRVDQWLQTLDGIYSEGKLRGAKNKMLEWRYGDTDHCETCQDLQGQKHKASWYLARNYIPGKAGAAMDCGGYRCQCALYDKDGNEYTL